MKNTKTTIKELTRQYRAVLKKCIFLNMLALGAVSLMTTNANAAVTLDDVKANALIAQQVDPTTQMGNYEYAIGENTISPDGTDTSFKYNFNGTETDLGTKSTLADTDYTFTGSDDATTTYDASVASIDAANYSYTNNKAGSPVALNAADVEDADASTDGFQAKSLAQTGYDYVASSTYRTDGATSLNIGAGEPTAGQYQFSDSTGTMHILEVTTNANGELVALVPVADPTTAVNATEALNAFNADRAAYNTELAGYNTDNTAYQEAIEKVNTDSVRLATLKETFASDKVGFDAATAAKNQYDSDTANYAAYNGSLSQTIDNKATTQANAAIAGALEEGGAIHTAVSDGITQLIGEKEANISAQMGYDLSASAGEVGALDTTLTTDDKTIVGSINELDATKADLADVYTKAEAGAIFAEKQQWVDNTLGIESANTDAVKNALTGSIAGEETTFAGAINVLDNQVAQNKTDIATNATNIAANKTAIENEVARATAAEDALSVRIDTNATNIAENKASIDTLNGDVTVDGSVKNTVANNAQNAVYTGTQVASSVSRAPATIGSALSATTEQVNSNTTQIATNKSDIARNAQAIDLNRQTIAQIQSDFARTNANNDARFKHLEDEIDDVNEEMKKGLASTAALASLQPLSNEYKTQISVGMGGYRDRQAIAVGGYHYVTDNVLLNVGGAWGGEDSISYKAGVTLGF